MSRRPSPKEFRFGTGDLFCEEKGTTLWIFKGRKIKVSSHPAALPTFSSMILTRDGWKDLLPRQTMRRSRDLSDGEIKELHRAIAVRSFEFLDAS